MVAKKKTKQKKESSSAEPSPPLVVLLDIDGTLVDTNYLHVDAWARALHELGVVVPRAAIHKQIGKGSDQFLPQFIVDAKKRKRAEQLHLRFYEEVRQFAFPLPGALELLDALEAEGHPMWLATSGQPEEVGQRLDTLGVTEKRFDGIVSSGDVKRSKPHPDLFEEALRRAGARAEDAVVIGDTQWDVEAARRAGIRSVALLSGGAFSYDELKIAGAESVFDSCADLHVRGLATLRR